MKFYIIGMDVQQPVLCARRLRQYGYSAVVHGSVNPALIEAVSGQGLSYSFSAGAFTLGGGFSRPAVDCLGVERRWFSSGCPSDPAMRAARLEHYAELAATPGVDAVMLDGARFASFASQEGMESFFTCFCDTCMQQAEAYGFDAERMKRNARAFRHFTQTGEGDVLEVIQGLSDWLAFRRQSVNCFLSDFTKVVHAGGKRAGAFVFAPSLAQWVGQDEAGQCGLDILAPMLYRRYPHVHGPACLNHEWAALMRMLTEKTGMSVGQAALILGGPEKAPLNVLNEGFAPKQIEWETARLSGGQYCLAPILQREDERLSESVRAAQAAGAQMIGLFAFDTIESLPDMRAALEE